MYKAVQWQYNTSLEVQVWSTASATILKMQDLEGMKGLITCYLVQVPVTGKRYED